MSVKKGCTRQAQVAVHLTHSACFTYQLANSSYACIFALFNILFIRYIYFIDILDISIMLFFFALLSVCLYLDTNTEHAAQYRAETNTGISIGASIIDIHENTLCAMNYTA